MSDKPQSSQRKLVEAAAWLLLGFGLFVQVPSAVRSGEWIRLLVLLASIILMRYPFKVMLSQFSVSNPKREGLILSFGFSIILFIVWGNPIFTLVVGLVGVFAWLFVVRDVFFT